MELKKNILINGFVDSFKVLKTRVNTRFIIFILSVLFAFIFLPVMIYLIAVIFILYFYFTKKNKILKEFLYSVIFFFSDLFFLFVFFIIYNLFLGNIMNKVISLLTLTGKALQGLTQTDITLNILSNQQQMNSLIVNIGLWIFGLIALSYALYCIFQGLVWFIAHKILKEKTNFKEYIKRFFAVNILWCVSFVIIAYFYVRAVIYTQVLRSPSNIQTVSIFSVILLIILSYFALISYVLIKKYGFVDSIKKSFSLAIKEFATIAPMYVLLVLGFAVIDVLLRLLFMVNVTLMVIIGIILMFPFIAYARLVIISVIKNLTKKNN